MLLFGENVLWLLVLIGVMIMIHELGHFWAARFFDVKVEAFSFGFGPRLFGFRRGDTDYRFSLILLGGYVKMAGENPEDVERDEQGHPIVRSDEFLAKTKWERFQVLIMGPIMNLLLAVVLTAIVLHQGLERESYEDQPVVVGVVTEGSVAAKADIRPGDRIVSVAGRGVDNWDQFLMAVGTKPNREISIGLLRNGLEQSRTVTPTLLPGQSRFEVGDIGVLPNVHPRLRTVTPNEPGDRAGSRQET
jgi:Predicted membrane-associated Zn-dependent proteases 1